MVRGTVILAPANAGPDMLAALYRESRREQRERHFQWLFGEAKIPPKFASATWEMFGRAKAAAAARQWARSGGKPFLLLHGPVGTGKTTLGTVAFLERLKTTGEAGLWREFVALFLELQAAFQTGEYERLLRGVTEVPLLLLDDLGMGKATPWRQEVLFVIVNTRYNNGLSTVFTTNLTPDALAEAWGEPVMSRIAEAADVIHMRGRDRRR